MQRYDAVPRPRDRGMEPGWGRHPGESYIENYGSYGMTPEAGPYRGGPGGLGRGMDGWGGSPTAGGSFGRGAWQARRGYDAGFGRPSQRDGQARRSPGVRYDSWSRGRGHGS